MIVVFEGGAITERCPHPVAVPRQHTHNKHQDGEAEHLNDVLVALDTLPKRDVLIFESAHGAIFELLRAPVQIEAGPRITKHDYGQRYAVVDDK